MKANLDKLPMMLMIAGSTLILSGVMFYVGSAVFMMLDTSGSMGMFEPLRGRYIAMESGLGICAALVAGGAIAWAAAFWLALTQPGRKG